MRLFFASTALGLVLNSYGSVLDFCKDVYKTQGEKCVFYDVTNKNKAVTTYYGCQNNVKNSYTYENLYKYIFGTTKNGTPLKESFEIAYELVNLAIRLKGNNDLLNKFKAMNVTGLDQPQKNSYRIVEELIGEKNYRINDGIVVDDAKLYIDRWGLKTRFDKEMKVHKTLDEGATSNSNIIFGKLIKALIVQDEIKFNDRIKDVSKIIKLRYHPDKMTDEKNRDVLKQAILEIFKDKNANSDFLKEAIGDVLKSGDIKIKTGNAEILKRAKNIFMEKYINKFVMDSNISFSEVSSDIANEAIRESIDRFIREKQAYSPGTDIIIQRILNNIYDYYPQNEENLDEFNKKFVKNVIDKICADCNIKINEGYYPSALCVFKDEVTRLTKEKILKENIENIKEEIEGESKNIIKLAFDNFLKFRDVINNKSNTLKNYIINYFKKLGITFKDTQDSKSLYYAFDKTFAKINDWILRDKDFKELNKKFVSANGDINEIIKSLFDDKQVELQGANIESVTKFSNESGNEVKSDNGVEAQGANIENATKIFYTSIANKLWQMFSSYLKLDKTLEEFIKGEQQIVSQKLTLDVNVNSRVDSTLFTKETITEDMLYVYSRIEASAFDHYNPVPNWGKGQRRIECIEIPETIEHIDYNTFFKNTELNNSLKKIIVPDSWEIRKSPEKGKYYFINKIHNSIFSLDLKKIGTKEEIKIYKRKLENDGITRDIEFEVNDDLVKKTIDLYSYNDNRFYYLDIPDNITKLEGFNIDLPAECKALSIPNNIKIIGDGVFSDNKKLENVRFNNGLEEIGDRAFKNCNSLKNIELPETMRKLGKECFGFCLNLSFVQINGNISDIAIDIFDGSNQIRELQISAKTFGKLVSQYFYKKLHGCNIVVITGSEQEAVAATDTISRLNKENRLHKMGNNYTVIIETGQDYQPKIAAYSGGQSVYNLLKAKGEIEFIKDPIINTWITMDDLVYLFQGNNSAYNKLNILPECKVVDLTTGTPVSKNSNTQNILNSIKIIEFFGKELPTFVQGSSSQLSCMQLHSNLSREGGMTGLTKEQRQKYIKDILDIAKSFKHPKGKPYVMVPAFNNGSYDDYYELYENEEGNLTNVKSIREISNDKKYSIKELHIYDDSDLGYFINEKFKIDKSKKEVESANSEQPPANPSQLSVDPTGLLGDILGIVNKNIQDYLDPQEADSNEESIGDKIGEYLGEIRDKKEIEKIKNLLLILIENNIKHVEKGELTFNENIKVISPAGMNIDVDKVKRITNITLLEKIKSIVSRYFQNKRTEESADNVLPPYNSIEKVIIDYPLKKISGSAEESNIEDPVDSFDEKCRKNGITIEYPYGDPRRSIYLKENIEKLFGTVTSNNVAIDLSHSIETPKDICLKAGMKEEEVIDRPKKLIINNDFIANINRIAKDKLKQWRRNNNSSKTVGTGPVRPINESVDIILPNDIEITFRNNISDVSYEKAKTSQLFTNIMIKDSKDGAPKELKLKISKDGLNTLFPNLRSFNFGKNNIFKNIPEKMFSGCKYLKEITLPQGLETIGDNAFSSSGITTITIPITVKTLGDFAFQKCESLEKVFLPQLSLKEIGEMCFSECNNLDTVGEIKSDETIANGQQNQALIQIDGKQSDNRISLVINKYAFANCGLTNLCIPLNTEVIEEGAFSNCINLANINIPRNVKIIGHGAFAEAVIQKTDKITQLNGLEVGGVTISSRAFFGRNFNEKTGVHISLNNNFGTAVFGINVNKTEDMPLEVNVPEGIFHFIQGPNNGNRKQTEGVVCSILGATRDSESIRRLGGGNKVNIITKDGSKDVITPLIEYHEQTLQQEAALNSSESSSIVQKK